MLKRFKSFVCVFTFSLLPSSVFADIVVIANPNLSVSSLSSSELTNIYLGKTKFLSNGGAKIIPVDQRSGSMIREKFYSQLMNKTEAEVKIYWSRIIFTGQGYPPIQEEDDSAVLNAVSKNQNCLGYIDRSALNNSVKVIYSF